METIPVLIDPYLYPLQEGLQLTRKYILIAKIWHK